MSGQSKTATAATHTPSPAFASRRGRTPAVSLCSETIAADIAAFKKRGGRIEILGNTPLRHFSPYRSRANTARKAATKTASAAKKSTG